MSDEKVTRVDAPSLAGEELPSLADFADEPGGAWPKGWYAATIIEGYATGTGKLFTTTDALSGSGTSRNMFLCATISSGAARSDGDGHSIGAGQTRNIREAVNYRPDDFTPENLARVKELREHFKGQRGAWPGQADAQRTSLAIGRLGQIEKAVGFRLKRNGLGQILPVVLVGQQVDVRLGIDTNGYNEITAFAPAGSRTAKGSK